MTPRPPFSTWPAHELRTPISVLAGYLSMLSDGSLGNAPNEWSRSLSILMAKTQELNKIVDDLLEAARIEAGALPLGQSRVDLRAVIQDTVARARARAELLGAEIVTGMAPNPVPVAGDARQLGRILDNLINNGLTYTARPPRLSITVSTIGNQAVVRVADNGVGIAVDERDRVFERFNRGSNLAFSKVSGTGLGLFISRELAKANGGSLVIEGSQPDDGTVFALSLPLDGANRA